MAASPDIPAPVTVHSSLADQLAYCKDALSRKETWVKGWETLTWIRKHYPDKELRQHLSDNVTGIEGELAKLVSNGREFGISPDDAQEILSFLQYLLRPFPEPCVAPLRDDARAIA